jgi:hypothetical protein
MVNIPNDSYSEQEPTLNEPDRLSARQQIIRELEELGERITSSTEWEANSQDLIVAIERVAQISTQLNHTTSLVIDSLPRTWEQERQQRYDELNNGTLRRQQTEFLATVAKQTEQLHADFTTKIASENERLKILNYRAIQHIINIKAQIWGLCGVVFGSLVTLGLAWLVIFPHQLDNARGADSEIVKYLSTTEGRLMRRSFTSGNKSLQECVRKGTKKSGKLICQVEIK